MPVTIEDVRKIAVLARLRLGPDEEAALVAQLSELLGSARKIGAAAGAGDRAAPAPPGPEAADEVGGGLPRQAFLSGAPTRRQGFLEVPEVGRTEDA